jgi:AraC-like DNA-binding protein
VRACDSSELAGGAGNCFVAGRTFIHFCKSPTLWGVMLWSRPGKDDLAPLARSLELELADSVTPHGSIVDVSRLTGVDSAAFRVLDGYVRAHFDALSRAVLRLALVRPSGIEGAVVAGFFEVLPKPYQVQVFQSAKEALAWLALEPKIEVPPDFDSELAELYLETTSQTPIVTVLGAHLEANLKGPSVEEAAKALGLSDRTLQRRLQEAGTSFQDEVQNARMRVAERLLLDTDASLTSIAFDVGYSSLQRFSALFRKVKGEAPSAWRKRHSSGAGG